MPTHTQNTIIGAKVSGSTGLGSSGGGGFGFDGDTSAGGSTTITIPSDLMTASCEDDLRGGGDPANSHFRVSLVWSSSALNYTLADYCGLGEEYQYTNTTYGVGDFSASGNNFHVDHAGVTYEQFYSSGYNSTSTITQKAAPTTGTVSLTNASSSTITNIQARWVGYNASFSGNETYITFSTTGTDVTSYLSLTAQSSFTSNYTTIYPAVFGGSASNSQFFEFGVIADAPGNPASDTASATLTSGGYYRLEILVTRSGGTTQTLIFNKPYVNTANPRLYARSEDSEPSD